MLKWATEEVDNPDLRDRGFMYWRLLAINPQVAGQIVLAEKPAITTDSDRMDRGALDQLLLHTGTIGSIYHKNPEVCFLYARHPLVIMLNNARQTFIRGTTGKALQDSPALNQHSRAVLVHASQSRLPPVPVQVPGPGPSEPQKSSPPSPPQITPSNSSKPTPATPSTGAGSLLDDDDDENDENGRLDDDDDDGDDDDERNVAGSNAAAAMDPYASLDSAFGGYAEPSQAKARGAKDDDLLF